MYDAGLRDASRFGHVYGATREVKSFTGNKLAGVAKLHPAQPYWCLEVVGVDPEARGFGIGTRLLEPVLDLADEPGQRCYLETMIERNVGWYLEIGFAVREAGTRWGSRDDVNRESRRTAGVLRVHH